tara:strand:- start:694 stop:954 length:261 start_codon:yes stop_codon:yes gene_type:complete
MALTKTEIVDKVEVVDTGSWSMVQVRTATVIKEDDTELSRSYHRHVVSPADDWSGESDKVKAICDAVHTADTKKAYEASQADPSTP